MGKNVLIGAITLFVMTGCGTIMEPSRRPVSINSVTPVIAFSDGVKFVGQGRNITFEASNRSRKGDEFVVLKEVGNEDNTQTVYIEREINKWAFWNIPLSYGLTYLIDLPTGGTGRLGRLNYQVPEFGELDHSMVSGKRETSEVESLKKDIEIMKLKNEIKYEVELERTKERTLILEASK